MSGPPRHRAGIGPFARFAYSCHLAVTGASDWESGIVGSGASSPDACGSGGSGESGIGGSGEGGAAVARLDLKAKGLIPLKRWRVTADPTAMSRASPLNIWFSHCTPVTSCKP